MHLRLASIGRFAHSTASTVYENTYADYSHGICLVRNAVVVDGAPMTVHQILADPALAALLTDEGVIAHPKYPLAAAVPVIVTESFNLSEVTGAEAESRATALGDPLSYQWRKNDANLTGETGTKLTLSRCAGSDGRLYSVVIAIPGRA